MDRSFRRLAAALVLPVLLFGCRGGDGRAGKGEGAASSCEAEQVRSEEESLTAALRDFEALIPPDTRIGSLLSTFQSAGRNSSLEIRRISPLEAVPGSRLIEQPFDLEVGGEFFNLLRFLEALSDVDRLIVVSGLHVRRIEDRREPEGVRASFVLSGYASRTDDDRRGEAGEGDAEAAAGIERLRERLAEYRSLLERRDSAAGLLSELASILPGALWCTELEAQGEGFLLKGAASDLRPVSLLYENMIASDAFTEVLMGDTRREGEQRFQMRFRYEPLFEESDAQASAAARRDPFRPPEGMEARVRILPEPAGPGGLASFRLQECILEIIAETPSGLVAYFQGPDGEPYPVRVGDRFADGEVTGISRRDGEVVVRQFLQGETPHRDVPVRLPR